MHAFRALTEPTGPSRPTSGDRGLVPPAVVLDGARRSSAAPALALDLLLALLVGGALAGLGVLVDVPPPVPAAVGAVAALVWVGADLARTGRTPGHRLLGTRTVDGATGFPVRLLHLGAGRTVDVRRGRDPVRVLPVGGSAPPPQVDQWHLTAARALNAPVVLVLDNGMAFNLVGPTVVGRNPARTDDATQLLQIPDLSRTMSKSHALLEPQGGMVWVTDLGSMNGTAVAVDGGELEPIAAHVRTIVRAGSRLEFGDRVATVGTAARGGDPQSGRATEEVSS